MEKQQRLVRAFIAYGEIRAYVGLLSGIDGFGGVPHDLKPDDSPDDKLKEIIDSVNFVKENIPERIRRHLPYCGYSNRLKMHCYRLLREREKRRGEVK